MLVMTIVGGAHTQWQPQLAKRMVSNLAKIKVKNTENLKLLAAKKMKPENQQCWERIGVNIILNLKLNEEVHVE